MLIRKIASAVAIVGAFVPLVLVARKRLRKPTVRNILAEAREAGRKTPHEGKPRKARRIARHLAKTMAPATRPA